jgi:hypothetical protein
VIEGGELPVIVGTLARRPRIHDRRLAVQGDTQAALNPARPDKRASRADRKMSARRPHDHLHIKHDRNVRPVVALVTTTVVSVRRECRCQGDTALTDMPATTGELALGRRVDRMRRGTGGVQS